MNMIFYAANGHGYCAYSFDKFFDTDKNLLQILVSHSDACTRHMKSNMNIVFIIFPTLSIRRKQTS